MSRKRILLLLTETFANGGIQRFNRTLLTALEELDCECEVLSLVDTPRSRQQWREDGPDLKVRVYAHSRWRFAAAAMRAIASGRFDEVIVGHVHFLELATSARWMARRRPRLLLVAHGVEVWDRIAGARRKALPHIDQTLCVSEYTAQSLRDQVPEIEPGRFTVFPNALATSWIEGMGSLGSRAHVHARYFLSVARLSSDDRTKGIITALEAFAQLPGEELRYVIAGGGNDLDFLRAVTRHLGIAGRVDFAGAVSDAELVALYRGCEAFVLPSGQEGFGIVYLEAMHFGTPVIAASAKGAVDVVRHEETGLSVPYGDVVALAAAMTRIVEDRALRERLRERARADVAGDGRFTALAFRNRLSGIVGAPVRGLESAQHAALPRLVFVNRFFHPDESATSRMLGDLARRLSRQGRRVVVVTSRQLYDAPDANLPAQGDIDGVRIVRVAGLKFGRGKLLGRAFDYLGFHVAANLALRRLLEPGDLVIAKTDPPLLSVSVASAARARGARQVNWLQDVFPEAATALGVAVRPRWLASLLCARRNASLRGAVRNVVIGSRMRDLLVEQGIDVEAIRVIPNWAAETADPLPVEASRLRAELGLQDRFVIGYSGNLGRAHEFDTFLGAARLLRDDPAFVFLVIGGGARLGALRSAVEREGLENFRFLPLQEAARVADSMAAADVHLASLLPELEGLIVPSKYYGVLAAARPAIFIGDADGEVARELRKARCGLQVDVGDSERLARELRALHADRERLATLGTRAREVALREHGPERAVQAWLEMLAEIASDAQAMPGSALALRLQSGT